MSIQDDDPNGADAHDAQSAPSPGKTSAERALEAMFAGKSPQQRRELYRDAYDWGPDRGREAVDA